MSGLVETRKTPSNKRVAYKYTPGTAKYQQVGLFSVPANLLLKAYNRLVEIKDWYTEERLKEVVVPFLLESHQASLRALDWLVTNYCKIHPILLYNPGTGTTFNLYYEYKSMLRRWTRKVFDPFCRRQRVHFNVCLQTGDTAQTFATTPAQLNFLQWAIRYNVLNYAVQNLTAINEHMNYCVTKAKEDKRRYKELGQRRKRKELSQSSATTICTVFKVKSSNQAANDDAADDDSSEHESV